MRYEYIEPIVAATKKVLEQVTGGEVSSGDVGLVKGDDLDSDVSILISVKGDSEGCIIVSLDRATVTQVCVIMNGMFCDCTALLEMDTIAELSNMIAGNATSSLNDLGYDFAVLPPSVVTQTEIGRKTAGIEIFQVLLSTRCGEITINVALTTN